jgi:hypothetical protein
MKAVETVMDTLRSAQLRNGAMTHEQIDDLARKVGIPLGASDAEIEEIVRKIESENDIRMTAGSTLMAPGWSPWLDECKAATDWDYWERYHQLLIQKGLPVGVISRMDELTDKILGLIENPYKEGAWRRRGLVLGHVQSGKTANYIGLINKAADAGYRVIIVIAGIQEDLRRQTQARIDEGFTGYDSAQKMQTGQPVGVGNRGGVRRPFSYTNKQSDFRVALGRQAGHELASIQAPVVFVIKKNPSTLRHLIEWLKAHNTGSDDIIHDLPMLLVDDEADNASINTAKNPEDATRINTQIRQVFHLFAKACYVGYTATPFANIFIDKDVETEEHGRDLFPEDFLVSLDPPSNYMGADSFFSEQEEEERNHLREIVDASELLPLKHDKGLRPHELPDSLYEAIRTFLLALPIRSLRGDGDQHASMLINVSRFIDVQAHLREQVAEIVWCYLRDIKHYSKLPPAEALSNSSMAAFYETWEREFCGSTEFDWADVQREFHRACATVRVVVINGRSQDILDYPAYEGVGLKAIAIGGFSLSRGLTLEGLCVSYFRRNSVMYDTLLQMARWFGYRPGYEDLCRIWMEPEGMGWFMHIHQAVEELRAEVQRMERLGMAPRDFGLKVRSHPDSLIVTARNKMRASKEVTHKVDLSSELIETHKVSSCPKETAGNFRLLDSFVSRISGYRVSSPDKFCCGPGNYFYHRIPVSHVLEFIEAFHVHPELLLLYKDPVREFIRKGMEHELALWDVVLCGLDASSVERRSELPCGVQLVKQERTGIDLSHKRWSGYAIGGRQRVSSRGIEKIGLTPEQADEAEHDSGGKSRNVPDHVYRAKRDRPLLMLHWIRLYELNVNARGRKARRGRILDSDAVAFGISFPGTARKEPAVEYVVNKTWIENVFGATEDVDEEIGDDGSMG